jgi:mono/diheme cytochrome c family protein
MGNRIILILITVVFMGCSHASPKEVNPENAGIGEKLFNTVGCLACHSVTGETRYGPPLKFSPDREVVVIRSGSRVSLKPDRQYIIRSLKQPDFEKVDGFQGKKMPSINLSEEDIEYLADYLLYINGISN